jgi:hypothetical protein
LGLLSGENDKSARHTTDGLAQVDAFYTQELPTRKFTTAPLSNNDPDLKVYQVSKEGGEPQFLHLITKDEKTVIVLASQEIKDLKSLKDAEAQSPEEIAFNEVVKQIENDQELALAAFESNDINNFPDASKFTDANKFRFRSKTVPFKPMSPDELYSEIETRLAQSGFTQISKEATYGGGNTYKITQRGFTTYLYLVPTSDNRTVIITSKDSPFQ